MTPLTVFEERLLAELTDVVESRTPRRSHRRPLTLAAAGTAAAGVATAVGIGLVGGSATSTPAYAVERDGDTVSLTIHDPTRLAGLDQAMGQAGVPARIVPISASCTEPPPRPGGGGGGQVIRFETDIGGTNMKVTISGIRLPPGYRVTIGQLSPETGMVFQEEISNLPRTCFPIPPGTTPLAPTTPAPH